MQRIVSLIPSATEIVCALGYQSQLVGRSHECDFPKGVLSLPACCEPAIDVAASSREINRQVKQRLGDALSIYRVDIERLAKLAPTLILTQSQCEVCAVSLKEVERAIGERIASWPAIVSLQPQSLQHISADIERVAEALGDVDAGRELIAKQQSRLDAVARRSGKLERPVRVACIEWLEPLMTAGNWVPELVELAGGQSLLSEKGSHSPWASWERLLEADPDRIVLMPCGFTIERTLAEIDVVRSRPEWNRFRAVREGAVYVADGHHYFNRPGPRIVETAEILAEIIDDVSGGQHEGDGWVRMPESAAGSCSV